MTAWRSGMILGSSRCLAALWSNSRSGKPSAENDAPANELLLPVEFVSDLPWPERVFWQTLRPQTRMDPDNCGALGAAGHHTFLTLILPATK
jgi:hypothetical protein